MLWTMAVAGSMSASSPPYADKNTHHPGDRAEGALASVPLRTMPMTGQSLRRADMPVSSPAAHKAAPQAALDLPELHGSVIARTDWTSATAAVGLYKLPSAPGEDLTLAINGVDATHGGIAVDQTYYATKFNAFGSFLYVNIATYDLESAQLSGGLSTQSAEAVCFDTALDPLTGQVWGITYNSTQTGCQLTKINYGTSVTTESTGRLDGVWNALAADAQGTLWGIRKIMTMQGDNMVCTGSELVRFNKENASFTVIGATGHAPEYVSSATIDPKTGRMFWTVSTLAGQGYLCEVNLTTGAATKLMDLPGNAEITGLFVKAPAVAEGAPAPAENLKAEFPAGAMSGTVSFTVPATLSDGSPASGSINYTVKSGETTLGDGSASAGSAVSCPVTLTVPGLTEFTVTLSNAAGESKPAKVSCFVGTGVPSAPQDVRASWADGKMTLTWQAVTESADGGYIDPAAVRYTVSSADGTVASGLREPRTVIDIAEPETLTRYSYAVTAAYDGHVSAPAPSNSVTLGVAFPPYAATLLSQDDFDSFTVVDANADGQTWVYGDGSAHVMMHNQHDTDDWLISVPLQLEAGKVYNISTAVYGSRFSNERFELKIGRAATAEAMTETLIEPTDLNKVGDPVRYDVDFTAPATGRYYIGLHGISPRFQFSLQTQGISISEGQTAEKPGAGLLTATPDPNGDYKVTLGMTAPDKDLSGKPLSDIVKSELYRGQTLVHTRTAPAPGSSWTYTDNVGSAGEVTYTFVSYTTGGEGKAVSASTFCGTGEPAIVSGIKAVENEATGQVTLTWTPVDTDASGNAINPAKVTYSVFTMNEQGKPDRLVGEGITGGSYTYPAVTPGSEQQFMQWAVIAVTEGGMSAAPSELTPVGKPYAGLEDSFAESQAHYLYGIDSHGSTAAWILASDTSFAAERSYDDDNGFLYFMAGYTDESADFFTGKISLEGMVNPALKFYTYPFPTNDTNLLTAKVREAGQDEWTPLYSKSMDQIGDGSKWEQVIVPLDAYRGKTIQVSIEVKAVSRQFSFIDKLAVEPLVEHDLRVNAVRGPKKAKGGYELTLDAVVENKGTEPSGSYTVELYADSEHVATSPACEGIAPEGVATVSLSHVMNRFATEGVNYSAKVVYESDMVPANDMSPETLVPWQEPEYPGVSGLSGTYGPVSNSLAWTQPDLDYPDRPTTESFEQGDAWAQDYDGWIFVDKDGSPAGGLSAFAIPGIRPGKTVTSFFVFDTTDDIFNETFTPADGDRFLASIFRMDDGPTDDWAISPELTGKAQTISFQAKSYRNVYPEHIEVWYSTGSTEPDDFIFVPGSAVRAVPDSWTRYEIQLPEGAERFAIHSCATGGMLLMVDDIQFTAGSVTKDLELKGYDVWRDRVKMNETLLTEPGWEDTTRDPAVRHTYSVIPVYNRGEGQATHARVGNTESLESVESGITVSRLGDMIVVKGAEGLGITVTDPSGVTLWRGTGAETTAISAGSGLRIVKAGTRVVKLMVP